MRDVRREEVFVHRRNSAVLVFSVCRGSRLANSRLERAFFGLLPKFLVYGSSVTINGIQFSRASVKVPYICCSGSILLLSCNDVVGGQEEVLENGKSSRACLG